MDNIIYADSANPDKTQTITIERYRKLKPAKKDVLAEVDNFKSKKLNVNIGSGNLNKEPESYSCKLDNNDQPTEVPVKLFEDVLDALGYAVFNGKKVKLK